MQVPALMQVVILRAVYRSVVLLLSTFSDFPIFAAGFFLCFWQLFQLLCHPPQRFTVRLR